MSAPGERGDGRVHRALRPLPPELERALGIWATWSQPPSPTSTRGAESSSRRSGCTRTGRTSWRRYLSGLVFHGIPLGRPIIGPRRRCGREPRDPRGGASTGTRPQRLRRKAPAMASFEEDGRGEARRARQGTPFVRRRRSPRRSPTIHKFQETEQYHVAMGSLGITASSTTAAMLALNNVTRRPCPEPSLSGGARGAGSPRRLLVSSEATPTRARSRCTSAPRREHRRP